MDKNNIVNGSLIKIPLEPKIAQEYSYQNTSTTGNNTIRENFWYSEDINGILLWYKPNIVQLNF